MPATRSAAARWTMRGLAVSFVVIVAVLHVLRPDVSPLHGGISLYASGSTLALITAAWLALASAIGVAAWTLRSRLLGIAALALAGVAAFPPSHVTPARSLGHGVCGLVFFVAVTFGLYRCHRSSSMLVRLLVAVPLLFLAAEAGVPLLGSAPALMQRFCFAVLVAGLVALPA